MVKEQPPRKGDGEERITGPRGGTTTVTQSGFIRKNFWLPREQNERLRLMAFRTRQSEADLLRRGIELLLSLSEQAEERGAGAAGDGDEEGVGEET